VKVGWRIAACTVASMACLLTRPLEGYGRGDAADAGVEATASPACTLEPLAFVKVADVPDDPTGFAAAGDVAWVLTKSSLGRYDIGTAGGLASERRLASNLDNALRVALSPAFVLFQQTDPSARPSQALFRIPRDARATTAPAKVRSSLAGPMGAEGERVFYATGFGLALTSTTDATPETTLAFETTGSPILVAVGAGTVATLAVLKSEMGSAIMTTSTLATPFTPPRIVLRTVDVAALATDGPRVVVADTSGDLKSYPALGGEPRGIAARLTGARALTLGTGTLYVATDSAVIALTDDGACRASVPFVAREILAEGAFVWATSGRALYRARTP